MKLNHIKERFLTTGPLGTGHTEKTNMLFLFSHDIVFYFKTIPVFPLSALLHVLHLETWLVH